MLTVTFMQNLLLYMTVFAVLSLESIGSKTMVQTFDIARELPTSAQSAGLALLDQATDTTPVPEAELVSPDYWRNVKKKLWAEHKENEKFMATTMKPTLNPWRDHQPYLTALGDALLKDVSAIRTPPTQTPPPTQEFVNNVKWPDCPELKIPVKVRVEVPPCSGATGYWLDPFEELQQLLTVDKATCGDVSLTQKVMPSKAVQSPAQPSNAQQSPAKPTQSPSKSSDTQTALVGTLHEEITLEGSTYDFKDCVGFPAFSVKEFIIRQGVQDDQIRESVSHEFSLPQRTKIFLKYSIAAPNGRVMGETNIFELHDDYFWWHRGNATGHHATPSEAVAEAYRVGGWRPKQCGNWTKAWTVHFNTSAVHANDVAEVHWRLALTSAMTILAWRDEQRDEDGLVRANKSCAVETAVVFWVLLWFSILVPCAILLWFWIRGAKEARTYCFLFESWLFPHTMAKPSKSFKF